MNRKAAVFLRQAALAAFVIGMGLMTLCAVIWSADNQAVSNRFSQHVELVRDVFFPACCSRRSCWRLIWRRMR